LVYHDVTDDRGFCPGDEEEFYTIPLSTLRSHFEYLVRDDYQTISLDDFAMAVREQRDLPPKSLVLTFDDGYASNYRLVFPLLKQFGLKASFFVIVDKVNTENYMSWQELLHLQDLGMIIGSHGMTHADLTELTEERARKELLDSKMILSGNLGRNVEALSIPRGFYNKSIIMNCEDVGYKVICTSYFGYNSRRSNLNRLNRIGITNYTPCNDFINIVSLNRKYIITNKIKYNFRNLVKKSLGKRIYTKIKNRFLVRNDA
jgi:peptidoglycan/xylan/chitin deacetylase (PgdA/CDA1 family)